MFHSWLWNGFGHVVKPRNQTSLVTFQKWVAQSIKHFKIDQHGPFDPGKTLKTWSAHLPASHTWRCSWGYFYGCYHGYTPPCLLGYKYKPKKTMVMHPLPTGTALIALPSSKSLVQNSEVVITVSIGSCGGCWCEMMSTHLRSPLNKCLKMWYTPKILAFWTGYT